MSTSQVVSWVTSANGKRSLAVLGGLGTLVWYAQRRRAHYKRQADEKIESGDVDQKRKRVAVNKQFVEQLKSLVPIVLPRVRSKEFLLLTLHTTALITRTLLSIYVAKLDGQLVKSIVDKTPNAFLKLLGRWLLIALPATYINSMIRFLESKLAIAFRTRLVQHVYELYFQSDTFYRIGNLDSRLSNPDQCLTEDVSQFCLDLAHIYSQLSKPIFDVVLMTAQLVMLSRGREGAARIPEHSSAAAGPGALAAAVIAGTGLVLRFFTPPFGKMIAEEARRYGDLRAAHARVITHAEEIAFYRGHKVEQNVLVSTYHALVKHMNNLYKARIPYTMLEQFLMKYVWGACGMVMIAIPVFTLPDKPKATRTADSELSADYDETVSNRTQDFITARGLLISAADAIERMMSSWKEITELAGRTARVHEMISIFKEVKEGKYKKQTVIEDDTKEKKKPATTNGTAPGSPRRGKGELETDERSQAESEEEERIRTWKAARAAAGRKYANTQGRVIDGQDYVKFEDVPIITPNGDVLVFNPPLNFEVKPGQHLLISGPNGCGKSSLFRMLGGLWPIKAGVMTKPSQGDVFYIPQRPYLTTGTLREQFTYPHSREEVHQKGFTDEDLYSMSDIVDLRYVVDREGGWDAVKDWREILSGGEKQRVGMARIFYHKPKYAILDECTSAVSIDIEGQMYRKAKDIGITLLTVTHRPTLWEHHTHLLQFDGQGGWKFSELNAQARLSLHDEKRRLESQLAGLPKVQQRLQELCEILGERSVYLKPTTKA